MSAVQAARWAAVAQRTSLHKLKLGCRSSHEVSSSLCAERSGRAQRGPPARLAAARAGAHRQLLPASQLRTFIHMFRTSVEFAQNIVRQVTFATSRCSHLLHVHSCTQLCTVVHSRRAPVHTCAHLCTPVDTCRHIIEPRRCEER